MSPTREECIKAAAVIASEGYRVLYTFPLEEAARRAVRPGGPSYEELLVLIADKRARNIIPTPEIEKHAGPSPVNEVD